MTFSNASFAALMASLIFTVGCGSTPDHKGHVQRDIPFGLSSALRAPLPELIPRPTYPNGRQCA